MTNMQDQNRIDALESAIDRSNRTLSDARHSADAEYQTARDLRGRIDVLESDLRHRTGECRELDAQLRKANQRVGSFRQMLTVLGNSLYA